MRSKVLFILVISLLPTARWGFAVESRKSEAFFGPDLFLAGPEVVSHKLSTDVGLEHIMVFRDGFSMSVGANRFSSDKAVVWLEEKQTEFRGRVRVHYKVRVYLEGSVSAKKGRGARIMGLSRKTVQKGRSMVVRFGASGSIFVTADKREVRDPQGLELYAKALSVISAVAKPEPVKPKLPTEERVEKKPAEEAVTETKVERTLGPDGTYVVTVIGRLYVWQKQEKGNLLELQADSAVVWGAEEGLNAGEESRRAGKAEDFLASGAVKAIYMSGDVVMTEGQRTIRADELY
jgi:hypothetical protein